MEERVSGEGLGQEQELASPEDAVRYGGAAERDTKIQFAGDIGYTRMPGSIPDFTYRTIQRRSVFSVR
jgi:hypothetical protein